MSYIVLVVGRICQLDDMPWFIRGVSRCQIIISYRERLKTDVFSFSTKCYLNKEKIEYRPSTKMNHITFELFTRISRNGHEQGPGASLDSNWLNQAVI